MYLTLGFVPTLLGFSVGLLLQGLLFQPTDLVHLAVNSLSLIAPLVVMHHTLGKKLFDRRTRVSWANILKLDAVYYGGVTLMVGFWLSFGEVATPLAAWLTWAGSYLAVVAFEPVVTYLIVKGMKKFENSYIVSNFFVVKQFKVA